MTQRRREVLPGLTIYRNYRTWSIDMRDKSGRRIRQSLHTLDEADAVRRALEIHRQPKRVDVLKLSEALEAFLQDRRDERGCKPETIRSYKYDLAALITFVGDVPLPSISKKELRSYVKFRSAKLAPATIRGYLRSFRAFFKWAEDEDLIDRSPARAVRGPKMRRTRRKTMTRDETRTVIGVLPAGSWILDYFTTLLATGMRPSELLRASGNDFSESAGTLRIPETKTDVPRVIELLADAREIITRRCAQLPSLSWPIFHGARGCVRSPGNVLNQSLKPQLPEDLKWVTLYCARHSFSARRIEEGWDQLKLAAYMGHKSPQTTHQHYADFSVIRIPVHAENQVAFVAGREV